MSKRKQRCVALTDYAEDVLQETAKRLDRTPSFIIDVLVRLYANELQRDTPIPMDAMPPNARAPKKKRS